MLGSGVSAGALGAPLVPHNLVDNDLIFAFVGESIDKPWRVLRPYIAEEEMLRGGDYQVYSATWLTVLRRSRLPVCVQDMHDAVHRSLILDTSYSML